ncbi:hypothetical protein DJ568_15415 [Mucilaginibacter hurinus]|uniref:Uncharacterized protein n=1 Tax=Mucilaginibacter hurinus TaxID=2201324 RepID=A0A367GM35_9SPHI|nr:hypothetical protein [Mucilaginibacter hurinus]RCH53926.1 hypothetical protein DJ568_15415 [Mucilaginibacter hurinus]
MEKAIVKTNPATNVLLQLPVIEQVKQEVFAAVNASIAKCYADLNYAVPHDTNYLVNEVTEIIFEKYPSLRIAEIPCAFAAGIRREYGEFMGLSVITFENFIQGYISSEQRRRLAEQKNRLANVPESEPTAEEKYKTARQLAADAYERVMLGRPIGLSAVTVYGILYNMGLIGPDYTRGMVKAAVPVYENQLLTVAVNAPSLFKKRELNTRLELLRDNIQKQQLTDEQLAQVRRTARAMAVTNYLRDLALNGEDLTQLMDNKYKEINNDRS